MGGFRAVEDRPTPKEVYNWRLYSEAIIIAFGSLLYVETYYPENNVCNAMLTMIPQIRL